MEAVRAGESAVFRQRRPRYYNQGRDWYFRTREGAAIGPFAKLSEAVEWAEDYADFVQRAPSLDEVINPRSVA